MPVASLEVGHFRGIPNVLRLEFGASKPTSILIFGDNGSGKSSIIDALEFGLQARLRRRVQAFEMLNLARSAASDKLPFARITLSDGQEISRRLTFVDTHPTSVPGAPADGYLIAPLVLRREDVTRFWQTPETERQMLFRSYFQATDSAGWIPLTEERRELLQRRRHNLKRTRRRHLETIARAADMPMSRIPLGTVQDFDEYISSKFKRELGRNWPETSATTGAYLPLFNASIEARRLTREILHVQKEIRTSSDASTGQARLADILREAALEVSTAFREVGRAPYVEAVELSPGGVGDISLAVRLRLTNGRRVIPERFLSEANLDLLSILVFTSISKAAGDHGQDRVLVLDDVVQSVDSSVRQRLFDYLLSAFSGWQFVISTHDRLWREILYRAFLASDHDVLPLTLSSWSFEDGPIVQAQLVTKGETLKANMESGHDAVQVCSAAGILLEEVCQNLSWRLPIAVTRQRGDRYTLGDLWPPVSDKLTAVGLGRQVDAINRSVHLRNLVGAHYVEWAQSVSDVEAREFANAVLVLADAVRCARCGGWIRRQSHAIWRCGCGAVTW